MSLSAPIIQNCDSNHIVLSNDRARAELFCSGAGIHNYSFLRKDGRYFQPLAEASWLNEYRDFSRPDVPRHLQLIGGEFPCIPFGSTRLDADHHGYGCNNIWQVEERTESLAVLSIQYPNDHVVERVRRTVELEEDTGALKFRLEVFARTDCRLPIGVHPIFRLPPDTNDLRIIPPGFERGGFAPDGLRSGAVPMSRPVLEVDRQSPLWDSTADLDSTLIQLWNTDGEITLTYPAERCAATLSWDRHKLPHCLLWIANPDLTDFPGGDGFVGLGIEPTNSFFDANDQAARYGELHKLDPQTFGAAIGAGGYWSTNYQIKCSDLPESDLEGTE